MKEKKEKSIIYYTDNTLDHTDMNNKVKDIIREAGLPTISISRRKRNDFDKNWFFQGPRDSLAILLQIMFGLEKSESETVFLAEHDVLYPKEHFELVTNGIGYNTSVYRLTEKGYIKRGEMEFPMATLFGKRDLLIEAIRKKIAVWDLGKFFLEPGRNDGIKVEFYRTEIPVIDIRHNSNFTYWRTRGKIVESVPRWGRYRKLRKRLGLKL